MANGNDTAVPIANDEIVQRAVARASRSWGGFRAWHQLEADDRLTLVESALRAPAGFVEELPLAL